MIYGVLTPIAVLGGIALVVVLFFQRGREGIDLSPRGVLRLYLYLASLAGIVVLTLGMASAASFGLARVAGDTFVYGGEVRPMPAEVRKCPPGATGCVEPSPEEIARAQRLEESSRERRRNEDLIRGATFASFGALFWGAHWLARRSLGEGEPGMAALRRGYLMLGTVVFGLATIVLLPTGIYQGLSNVLLPSSEFTFRQGADALGGGIVSLPVWLLFLRLVVREFRQAS